MLGFVAALWGASYLFIKIALDGGVSPAAIVFIRTALAAVALLPFALRRDAFRGLRPAIGWIVLVAAVQVVAPFMLISGGEQWIASGLAGVLVASVPIFTALLAPFFDRAESPDRGAVTGIVVGLVGVAFILGVDLSGGGRALLGGVMVASAGLGYAIGGFVVKRRLGGVDTIGTVVATMGVSALMSLPFAAIALPSSTPGAGPIAALLVLGVGGTGIAFIIFYGLIARVGPARASLVTYIAPGFAVFYGVALYGEKLTIGAIVGLVLIVGGSWLAGRGRGAAGEKTPSADASVPALG
jgi:drug/metabolite transporter (DMT)-like permease